MMEVPDDVEVGRLVEAMVEHMQLPTTGPNGRSIRYYLSVHNPAATRRGSKQAKRWRRTAYNGATWSSLPWNGNIC